MSKPVEKEYNENGDVIAIKCRTCHEMKGTDHYAKTGRKAAFNTQCKECKAIYDAEYRARTKERRAEKQKVYREKNRDKLLQAGRKKYKENPQKYVERVNEYRRKKVETLGYGWERFHERARRYAKIAHINSCSRCNKEGKIELHHPSYKGKDMWKIVVPLCRDCHRYIEQHPEECPMPVDLQVVSEKYRKKHTPWNKGLKGEEYKKHMHNSV